METFIIVLSIIAVVLIGILFMLKKSNTASAALAKFRHDKSGKQHEMVIRLEPLPADTQIDTSKLIEITNEKLISRITHIVPNMLSVLTSAGTALKLNEVASWRNKVIFFELSFRKAVNLSNQNLCQMHFAVLPG